MATERTDRGFDLDEVLGAQLTAVRLEGVVDLFFGEDREYRLQIERDFTIRSTTGQTTVDYRPYEDPWVPRGMNELVSLYRSAVIAAQADERGALRISFSDSQRLEVEPDPQFEGWNFYSSDGHLGQRAGGGLFYFNNR
jgi:hypothetical protein